MSHYHKAAGILGRQARRWARVSRQILERAGWRCRKCGRAGRLEVDHTWPLERGGEPWELGNLQVLCRGCHLAKTAKENRRELTPAELRWQRLVGELGSRH